MTGRRPLDGIRVLEIGGRWAGAGVGRMLVDFGASVTKVRRPNREPTSADLAYDRGKSIVVTDLAKADVDALLKGVDVVVENGRPGRLEKFGLSAEQVRAKHPGIVHLSLPGFPSCDSRRTYMATEGVVCAAAGLYAERGLSHRLRGSAPAVTDMPMASAYAMVFGVLAVLVALLERRSTGAGDTIEVSLYNALLEGLSYNHLRIEPMPDRYADRRAQRLAANGTCEEADLQRLMDPIYRSYECADGRWFYLATPPHRLIIPKTLAALGLWDALVEQGLPTEDPYIPTTQWKDKKAGSIFAVPALQDTWLDALYDSLRAVFASEDSATWSERFAQAGIAGHVVQSRSEWLQDAHATSSGLIDPQTRAPGPFVWQASASMAAERLSPKRIRDVRILDLANVIAGPTIAGALARYGVDVVKIDAPTPNFDPYITVVLSLQYGRGKRSILLDIKAPKGRAAFERLVKTADVITYNGAPPQAEDLGISAAALQSLNPRASLIQVSALAGPKGGTKAANRGYDEIAQAAVGIMHAHRPDPAPPEEFAMFGTVDVITGLLGACAAAASLHDPGSAWATSLASGAQVIQFPMLTGELGVNGAIRRTDSGWMFFDPGARSDVDRLSQDGLVAAHPASTYSDLYTRHAAQPHEHAHMLREGATAFVTYRDHPAGQSVTLLAPTAIRSGIRTDVPRHSEKYGASTRDVLGELGLSSAEIDDLIAEGVAAERWPNHQEFLPT